jgi:hypothetical protein
MIISHTTLIEKSIVANTMETSPSFIVLTEQDFVSEMTAHHFMKSIERLSPAVTNYFLTQCITQL